MVDRLTESQPLPPGAGSPLLPGAPQSVIHPGPRRRDVGPGVGYLRGRKNVVGLVIAVVAAMALLVTGIAGPFWPLVAIGAYAAAVLLSPAPSSARPAIAGTDEIQEAMQRQLSAIAGRVPGDVYGRIASIHGHIRELLPQVERLPPGSEDLYILRSIPLDYLPATVSDYLALPRATAGAVPGGAAGAPKQMLMEQLDLLDGKLEEISTDIAAAQVDRLAANGRFLRERFGRSDLEVPGVRP